jgi:uncharacterized repeat protein (TIGR01451 family)
MKNVNARCLAVACAGWLTLTSPILCAQGGGGQSPSPSTPPASTPSPGAGITSGTAPIETTLFAYRALASDAEAIAGQIARVTKNETIVIGSAADLSAFVQWRTILSQAKLLKRRAADIHIDLATLFDYNGAIPLAALNINKKHTGDFAQGGTGKYTLTVSNGASASPTYGRVIVTESVPDGLTLVDMNGGPQWDCSPPASSTERSHSCFRDDPLSPGASYQPILVTVRANPLGITTQYSVVNSATVAGGNSAPATATDPTNINPSAPAPPPPPRRGQRSITLESTAPPPPTTPPTPSPAPSPFGTALSAIPTFIQLAQFLATSFAVNQTLSPTQGSMTDTPLINAVAQHLRNRDLTVLVPSTYTPRLLNGKDLEETYLWKELHDLESARIVLWSDLGKCNAALMLANFVTQNPTKYSAKDLNNALANSGKAQSLITSAQAIGLSIDSFEASLFGGQTASPSPSATSPSAPSAAPGGSNNAANNTGGQSSPSGQSNPSSQSSQTAQTPPSQLSPATPPSPAPSSSAPPMPAISIQQVITADFLAQRIWNGQPQITDRDMESVNFLTVHALESGGSQLIKTNIFYGTHIFFSGGSVMTFSLFKSIGDLRCSGFAYNYRGNVREKNYEDALRDPAISPALLSTDSGCEVRPTSVNETQITEGMTVGQVEAMFGAPDVKFESKGVNYVYRSRRIVVVFHRGRVKKILPAS